MSFLINDAYAQNAGTGQGDPMISWLILIGMFVLFYFVLIRPQQKRAKEQKQMIDALKVGDEVISGGGVLGKITAIGDQFATIEVAPNTLIKVQRFSISAVLPKGTLKSVG